MFQVIVRLPAGNHKVVKFPNLLAGLIPSGHLPGKLTPGLGDARVSAESVKFSAGKYYNFTGNHVKASYDKKIHGIILDFQGIENNYCLYWSTPSVTLIVILIKYIDRLALFSLHGFLTPKSLKVLNCLISNLFQRIHIF